MEKPTFTQVLVKVVIILLMALSVAHAHECCAKAAIENLLLYDTILVASYASLFALKSILVDHDSNEVKRNIWLTRGGILLLLLLPHVLCGINAPPAVVSSSTIIDNETAVALVELGVLETLIDTWLGLGGGPNGGTTIKPMNKEKVS